MGCDPVFRSRVSVIAISIHAPIVGCDVVAKTFDPKKKISIHAPIVGCDLEPTLKR